jgi:hypothetical protein
MSQLVTPPEQWSEAQVLERMSVFTSVKATAGCEQVSSLVTVPLFRSLVSCAGGLGLDQIRDKSFVVTLATDGESQNMRVLEDSEIAELAPCLVGLEESLDCS